MQTLREMTADDRHTWIDNLCAETFETTIAKQSGNGKTFSEQMGDFPVNAVLAFLAYGFQRKVNDNVGGATVTTEQKIAGAEKLLARYKAGDVGRDGMTSVDREIDRQVRAWYESKHADAWAKAKTDDAKAKLVAKALESDKNRTAFRAAAETAIAERARIKAERAAAAKKVAASLGDITI